MWEFPNPVNARVQFRFHRGESIERSDDSGRSWTEEVDLSEIGNEVRIIYYEQNAVTPHRIGEVSGIVSVRPGPLDAAVDPKTGNMVLAMGHDGLLVRLPDGQWQWAKVGTYSLQVFDKTQFLQLLVNRELWLAGLLVILSLATVIQPMRNDIRCVDLSALALAWVTWGSAALIFIPATRQDFLGDLVLVPILAICVLSGGSLAIMDVFNVFDEKPTALLPMFGISVVTAFLFLLPYVLWTQGNVQHHSTATLFAIALTTTSIFAGQQHMKRVFRGKPLTRKRKKVDKQAQLSAETSCALTNWRG